MFKIVKDSIGIKKLLIYMKFNPIKRFLTIWFFMVGILFDVSAQNITIEWKINPLIKRDAELQTHQVLTPFQCLNCFEKLSQDNNYLIPYYTNKHANKQTKHANKHANKQTKHANKNANKHANKHTKHTNKHTKYN